MAPDFEKFALLKLSNEVSHTWWSISYFTLPVGLMLTFLFHLIVRDSLIHNLPVILRTRLTHFCLFNWPSHFRSHYIAAILSILLGGVTHILWDELTHNQSRAGLPIWRLPSIYHVGEMSFGVWLIINISTSLLGCWYIWRVIMQTPPTVALALPISSSPIVYWFTVLGLALLLTGIRCLLGSNLGLWDIAITCISTLLIGLTLTSLLSKTGVVQ